MTSMTEADYLAARKLFETYELRTRTNLTVDEAWQVEVSSRIRLERNALLTQTDYTQTPDSPPDTAEWATYRQALRDIPAQEGFPFEVQWPELPAPGVVDFVIASMVYAKPFGITVEIK